MCLIYLRYVPNLTAIRHISCRDSVLIAHRLGPFFEVPGHKRTRCRAKTAFSRSISSEITNKVFGNKYLQTSKRQHCSPLRPRRPSHLSVARRVAAKASGKPNYWFPVKRRILTTVSCCIFVLLEIAICPLPRRRWVFKFRPLRGRRSRHHLETAGSLRSPAVMYSWPPSGTYHLRKGDLSLAQRGPITCANKKAASP